VATVTDRSGNNPVDRKYASPNRTVGMASAMSGLTPAYPGEFVLALDTGERFMGLSGTTGAWGKKNDVRGATSFSGGGFPDATTTGPTVGTVFTNAFGEFNTTSNGQIVEKLNLDGYILVNHNNVTIQDCNIFTSNPGPGALTDILVTVNRTGTTIRRCKIVSGWALAGILLDENNANTVVEFCNISNCENGITIAGSSINIHDNYIHDLAREPGHVDPHFDGMQGFPGYSNWTINHNTIQGKDTSSIILGGNTGPIATHTVSITNNLLLHQGPTAYGVQCKFTDGLTVTGNRISVEVGPPQYPIFPIDLVGCVTLSTAGNVVHETGAPITPSVSP